MTRLKDVPAAAAYVVDHDPFDKGAMEVWPCVSLERAEAIAKQKNDKALEYGYDECNVRAYTKLPRVRIWKLHTETLQ